MKHANLTDQWFAEKFTGNILFHWSGWKLFLDHLWIFGCYYLRYVCYVSSIVALFCVTELLLTVAALGLALSLGVGGVVRCDEWELPGQEIYTTVEEAGNWWLRSLYSDQ